MERNPVGVPTPDLSESSVPGDGYTGPTTVTEKILAEVLADVVGAERVPVESHFFDDLGANSLVMAHFCARVRKREDVPSASMKDVYLHPTVRTLAAALGDVAPPAVETPAPAPAPAPAEATTRVRTARYVLCGFLQLMIFFGYSYLSAVVTAGGYEWVSKGSGLVDIYLRSVIFGSAALVGLCAFPVAAKWILIGRWKPREFPVWGLTYLRFWTVKVLVHANPMVLFVGNPLYVLYLRALGARIGKHVTILSRTLPVCTDLFTVGAGTVIRKDAFFLCYRAHEGRIQTGPVTLGRDVFIGERTVIDIDTSMGDGAQLGHTSTLQRGEEVPAGQTWHGSPAQRTELNYLRVEPAACGTLRRAVFCVVTLLQLFIIYMPLVVGGAYMLFTEVPELGSRLDSGTDDLAASALYIDAVYVSALLFFGFLIVGLIWLFTVPRLLNLAITPGKVYPLYGIHHSFHRATARMTNIKFFKWLFGDSSYIVHYLRALGYDLSHVEQTGSNFGQEVQHESPFMSSVGTGTMVADGLSIINAEFSSTSFRLAPTSIGARNFLGNHIAYPAGGRTGTDCLLATKVMIPLEGDIREGVGLLGSPPFEIPRTVERDSRFDHLRRGDELRLRLAAKNRYNLLSIGIFLTVRWLHVFVLTVIGLATVDAYGHYGHAMIAAFLVLGTVFTALYYVLVERCFTGFRPLRPRLCSIYDPYFWWHERLWKVPDTHLAVFNGTPFKNLIWRLLGVRVGSRVFDDGAYITERTLATIGDDCTLNAGSKIQCHSQEDGTFKSDHITVGDGCTLGIGSLVHYGATVGDGAVLAADSFLMKGEDVPPRAWWGGNPATELRGAEHARLNGSSRRGRPAGALGVHRTEADRHATQ